MSCRTPSELLFEEFCERKGIRCHRVNADTTRTPDYELFLPRRKVVTEVKEIVPNAAERAADVAFRRGEPTVVSSIPGQRVRGKISDAVPQIKARTKRLYPGLLVLYEDALIPRHIDPYQVRVAMFGFESVVIAVPNDPRSSPYFVGREYGRGRKMTPAYNTTVSALGVLSSRSAEISMTVYHNLYAKIPLAPGLMARYGIPQFKLGAAVFGRLAEWEAVA